VVAGITHVEPPAGCRHHSGRVAQHGVLVRNSRQPPDRRTVERAGGLGFSYQLLDDGRDLVCVDLARLLRRYTAGGVNQHERGPGAHGVGLPHLHARVVDDRVGDAQPLRRLTDALGLPFGRELGAVHAKNHQFVGELLAQTAQGRLVVRAVVSANQRH
jgi:hypothetical protein